MQPFKSVLTAHAGPRAFLFTVPIALVIGCGGDDDTIAEPSGDNPTFAEQFGDDPTFDECIDGIGQVLRSIEVPDGVDPIDGLDEDELPKVEAEIRRAFTDFGVDPDGEDDPSADYVGPESDAATAEIMADLDPAVLAMLNEAPA